MCLGSVANGPIIELGLDAFLWQFSLREGKDEFTKLFLLMPLQPKVLLAATHIIYNEP
jgi:hypothetical protein